MKTAPFRRIVTGQQHGLRKPLVQRMLQAVFERIVARKCVK